MPKADKPKKKKSNPKITVAGGGIGGIRLLHRRGKAIDEGILRPRDSAVLRFNLNSNVVGN
jgi:hypothetical protein